MRDHRPQATAHPRQTHPPFVRIACVVESGPATEVAITQAIAMAGRDSRVLFVATWYGRGDAQAASAASVEAQERVEQAADRAREAGVRADWQLVHAPTVAEGLGVFTPRQELIVAGAHTHARVTGIVLGETATQLVHRSPIPVLVARERPISDGVLAATRACPADRPALTAAARIAARTGAELTVIHIKERGDKARTPELQAELANTRAQLGRQLDFFTPSGPAARTIVDLAEGDGAGLVVVGSRGRTGVPALSSVSERVAHLAPCSVLVMRGA